MNITKADDLTYVSGTHPPHYSFDTNPPSTSLDDIFDPDYCIRTDTDRTNIFNCTMPVDPTSGGFKHGPTRSDRGNIWDGICNTPSYTLPALPRPYFQGNETDAFQSVSSNKVPDTDFPQSSTIYSHTLPSRVFWHTAAATKFMRTVGP